MANKNNLYEEAWLDVSDNNDLNFLLKILNSKIDSTTNLYLGMFKSFLNKISATNKTYENAKTFFINKTNTLLSGNEDIEPEYSEYEYEAIEFLQNLSIKHFIN